MYAVGSSISTAKTYLKPKDYANELLHESVVEAAFPPGTGSRRILG